MKTIFHSDVAANKSIFLIFRETRERNEHYLIPYHTMAVRFMMFSVG